MELLHELVPTAKTIALLVNPSAVPYAETISGDLQAAARKLGLQFHVLHASAGGDFNSVFARLAELRVNGLVIGSDPFFNSQSEQLAALAVRHAVPAIYQYRKFAAAGGLTSYGGRLRIPMVNSAYTLAGFSRARRLPTCPLYSPLGSN